MAVPLALRGRIVTMDARRRVLDDGVVWIGADERIAAVTTAKARSPTGLKDAIMVETGGVVYPGLIDLHGHMVYNALSLWSPPGQTVPFASRGQWPHHPSYEGMVSDPANALGALAGKALLKYVEVKAVIGGTTAVQGSTKMAHPYDGWLVRNVEFETFGGAKKKSVFQDVRPPSKTTFPTGHKRLAGGGAWLFHTAEGTDPALRSEYEGLRDGDCLLPGLGAIHCTALTDDDFKQWGKGCGAVIWSPFSNLWLYRDTTKIDAAKRHGLLICLGSDWSPSGSKHLLAELKVADLWTKRHLPSGTFSDRDLCAMVTINPAAALRWSDRLGALRKGCHGDVLVTTDRGGDPYRNLIESTEKDVLLVAINGQPFYGTTELMQSAAATRAEPIDVGGRQRQVELIYPDVKDADMGWAAVLEDLAQARADPMVRYLKIEKLVKAGKPPPWLMTDKPWDDPSVTGKPVPIAPQLVTIPPLDSLTHDAAYFQTVHANPILNGVLDDLHTYYKD